MRQIGSPAPSPDARLLLYTISTPDWKEATTQSDIWIVPMSGGAGGEARQPLGLVVVGGLLFSQLVTLYVTPVFYTYLDELQQKFSRRRAKKAAPVRGSFLKSASWLVTKPSTPAAVLNW